jgi:foldase protein PrsA
MNTRELSRLFVGLLLAAALLGGPGLARPVRADDTVIADVNGEKITQTELLAELQSRFGYQVREVLIIGTVVDQEAKKKGLTVTDAEIDAAAEKDKADVASQGNGMTFEQWLLQQDLTVAAYRGRLRNDLLLQKIVAPSITDDMVKQAYETLKPLEEALKLSYISVATQEEAQKLRDDLVAGKLTWDQAAAKYNLDPHGQVHGTEYPFIAKTNINDAILQALQKDGDITAPLVYQGQWNLVRRDAYRPAGKPPFEQVQAELRQQLVENAARGRLGSLMDVADIKRFGDFKKPGE